MAKEAGGGVISAPWAYGLAEPLLAEVLPRRWRHSQGVGAAAADLRSILKDDAELLHAAALLHDVGYAPDLALTGFHALDGARFLRNIVGAPDRVVRLVAHHSCSSVEADERGLVKELAEFEPEDRLLTDAMIWCDMTTARDGHKTSVAERLAEIEARYGPDSVVGRFIVRAAPDLRSASVRIEDHLKLAEARPAN